MDISSPSRHNGRLTYVHVVTLETVYDCYYVQCFIQGVKEACDFKHAKHKAPHQASLTGMYASYSQTASDPHLAIYTSKAMPQFKTLTWMCLICGQCGIASILKTLQYRLLQPLDIASWRHNIAIFSNPIHVSLPPNQHQIPTYMSLALHFSMKL